MKLSASQIFNYAKQAGFSTSSAIIATAIALAESSGVTDAKGYNRNTSGGIDSVDRGVWQINNVWHPEISDTCAFDPACAARAAYTISNKGTDFHPWSTFSSGIYTRDIPAAQQGAASAAVDTLVANPNNVQTPLQGGADSIVTQAQTILGGVVNEVLGLALAFTLMFSGVLLLFGQQIYDMIRDVLKVAVVAA